jgi:hypothetical protein
VSCADLSDPPMITRGGKEKAMSQLHVARSFFVGWVSRMPPLPNITPLGTRRNPPSAQRAPLPGRLRAAPLSCVDSRSLLRAANPRICARPRHRLAHRLQHTTGTLPKRRLFDRSYAPEWEPIPGRSASLRRGASPTEFPRGRFDASTWERPGCAGTIAPGLRLGLFGLRVAYCIAAKAGCRPAPPTRLRRAQHTGT